MYISYLLLVCRYSYANHLFLLHYELHAEVKSIHRSSVGMLPVENMLICNISKQKIALNLKTFFDDILIGKITSEVHTSIHTASRESGN